MASTNVIHTEKKLYEVIRVATQSLPVYENDDESKPIVGHMIVHLVTIFDGESDFDCFTLSGARKDILNVGDKVERLVQVNLYP